MYACILDQRGEIVLHRTMQTDPATFLKAIAPSRAGTGVAVACLFPWYGLADRCADAGIPCVLGHALSMKAIHGGKATNDPIEAHKIAGLLRGGLLPQASVSPAKRRATRALLRRRMPLARKRAELLAHVQHTNSQYNLPAIGKKMASKATRDGVAARFAAPAVHKCIAVALARLPSDDALLGDVERTSVHTAKPHDVNTLYRRHTVPGLGTILRLVRLDDIHASTRLPRVQDVVSSGRLVKCAQAAAGKRWGTAGTTSGKAHLKGAFSAAAVLFLRAHPAAQKDRTRLEKNHATGTAWTGLAQKLARAVSHLRKRQGALERETCCQRSGRGGGEPGAALDTDGLHLQDARAPAASTASLHAKARRGRATRSPAR
jgi:hypothetical protein